MQCVEFENRLNDLLDNRIAPEDDPQLNRHAQDCDACAGTLFAQQRLFQGLQASRLAPSADLPDRILSRRHNEVQLQSGNYRKLAWAVLLASAASIGGLALLALQSPGKTPVVQPPTKSEPIQKQRDIAVIVPDRKSSPLVVKNDDSNPLVTNANSQNLNSNQVDKNNDEKFDDYFVALENFAAQLGDPKQFDGVSESLSPSFKPIRSSFGLALDALRRTMPRGKEPKGAKPDSGARFVPELPVLG